jgi:alpha-glucan, water dikinase
MTTGNPLDALRRRIGQEPIVFERVFEAEALGQLAAAVKRTEAGCEIRLVTNVPGPLTLHWGIARRSPREWLLPPESLRPPGTILWQDQAAQTPFTFSEGLHELRFAFSEREAPLGIQFVLRQGESAHWLKDRGGNFYLPLPVAPKPMPAPDSGELAGLAGEIVRAETGHGSWTLMHRFNLCHDLLERVRQSVEGLGLLYVWLRFSAIRQLTWQRNYNTQPRELSHAQDRLTRKLGELYRGEPQNRPFIRLMLTTVGRGGEGQRIRDEILNIMHRHHIKEVSGRFLEEWHQKLHNNTTPDDIVICEAYLEFLYSNGNLEGFYRKLEQEGVTRQRLESFERPIRSQPDFVSHLKDGLIHDFQDFLRTLKAVHAGTDFETAVNAARAQLDGDTQRLLGQVWDRRNDPSPVELVEQITAARHRLSNRLAESRDLRELLYLDLALEQLLRVAVERNLHTRLSGDQLVDLIAYVLENVALSYEDAELAACMRHWERLRPLPRLGAEWSLHAKSVVDRIRRALVDWIDHFYRLLQPKAELLGHGFNADTWTILLFSEEVVRGSSLGFVLSLLLNHLDPLLRQAASLGGWQVISRGSGAGRVEVMAALRSIQGRRLLAPTVVVTDQVAGDEEIPEGVVAVIAPDVTDLVSHVAIRARNANVLFASCYDPEMMQRLKSLQGRRLHLKATAAGDVVLEEAAEEAAPPAPRARLARPAVIRPAFTRFAITAEDFNERIVGGKSCVQARLRGRLPGWIRQPPSVAVPFGVFERVLSLEQNKKTASRCDELVRQTDGGDVGALAALRESICSLTAPEELRTALRQTMGAAGLGWPENWDEVWDRLKRVWASKWNERAFLSRRRMALPHEDLFMAVLIQPVVEADYAFVIHTVNPATGNRDELYAEVVLGLGETLVGNYPGRALSFTWDKKAGQPKLAAFPGKSVGLYGSGLIFRSDSNGEDLAGYAGAGLYDSVLLPAPRKARLDYSEEPLVWDAAFRSHLLNSIARIGLAAAAVLGTAQDVEGVFAKGEFYLVQARPQVGLEND